MNLWPFNRKSREQALVEFAGFHVLCDVQRDADDRPFVMICRTAIRLDDPAVIEERNVIWIKRRADDLLELIDYCDALHDVEPGAPAVEPATVRPEDLAAALAHRACCGVEHDPAQGKLHGCCVVCGVPWPCDTAKYFLRPSPTEPAK